jgi:hypothetical protein
MIMFTQTLRFIVNSIQAQSSWKTNLIFFFKSFISNIHLQLCSRNWTSFLNFFDLTKTTSDKLALVLRIGPRMRWDLFLQ